MSILLIVLVFYLPFFLIRLVLPYEQIFNRFGYTGYEIIQDLIQILGALIEVIGFISFVVITESSVRGKYLSMRKVLSIACSRWWAVIKSTFISGIVILFFTLLLIIPGIVRSIQYAFVRYAAAIRDVSGKKALEYSKSVTEGQRWRVFGFYFLIMLLGLVSTAAYFFLIYLSDFDKVIVNIALLIQYFISPFFIILFCVLFLDLESQSNTIRMNSKGGIENTFKDPISSP
jgi:hypothetical protein